MSNYANYNQKITNVISNTDNNILISNQIKELEKQKSDIEKDINISSKQYLKEMASKGILNPIAASKYKAQLEANKILALKELNNEYNAKIAELDKNIVKGEYLYEENAIKAIVEKEPTKWKITKNDNNTNTYIKTDTYKPYKEQKQRIESYDKETYVFKDGKPIEYIEKEPVSRDNGNKHIEEKNTLKFDNYGRVNSYTSYNNGEKNSAEFYTFSDDGSMKIKSKDYSSKKEQEKILKAEIPVKGQIYTNAKGENYAQLGNTALDIKKNENTGKWEYKDISKATETLKTELPSAYNKDVTNAYSKIGIQLNKIEFKKPEIKSNNTEIKTTSISKNTENKNNDKSNQNFFGGLSDYMAKVTGINTKTTTLTNDWENNYTKTASKLNEIGEGIENYEKTLEPTYNKIKEIQNEYSKENAKGKNADIDKLNTLAKQEEEIFKDKNFEKMKTRYNELVNNYQKIYEEEYIPLKKNTPYIYKNVDEKADTSNSTQMTNADKMSFNQNDYESKLEFADKYNINPKTKTGQLKSRETLYEEKNKIDDIKTKYSETYKNLDKLDKKLEKYTKYTPLFSVSKDIGINSAKLSVNLGQGAEEFYQTYKNLDNTEDKKIIKNKEIKENIIKELAKNIIKNKTEQAKEIINENKDKTVEKTNILEKINSKFNINKNNLDKDQTKEASAMMGATTEVIAREGKDGVVSVGKFFKDVTRGLYKIGNEYLAVELPKKQEIIAKQKFKEIYNREPTNTVMDSNRMAIIAMKDLVLDKPKNAIENTYVFMKDENNRLMLIPAAATIAAKFTKGEIDRFSKQPVKVAIEYGLGWKEGLQGTSKIASKTKEALSPIKNEAVKKIKQTAETINNTKVKFEIKEKIPTNPEELANSIKARQLSNNEILSKVQSIIDKDMAELRNNPDYFATYNFDKKRINLNKNLPKEEIIKSKIHEKTHALDESLNILKFQKEIHNQVLNDIDKLNIKYPERVEEIITHINTTKQYKKKQIGSEMLARFAETYPEEILKPTTSTGRYLKKRFIDEQKFDKVLSVTTKTTKTPKKITYDLKNTDINQLANDYAQIEIDASNARKVFGLDKKSKLSKLNVKLKTNRIIKEGEKDITQINNELNELENKIKFEYNKKGSYKNKKETINELRNLYEIKQGELSRAKIFNEKLNIAKAYKFENNKKKIIINQIKNKYGKNAVKQFLHEVAIDKLARIKASGKKGAIIPDFEHQTNTDFKVDKINKQINKNNKANLEIDKFVDENGKEIDFKEYNKFLKTDNDIKLFKQRLLKHYKPEKFIDTQIDIKQTPTTKDGVTEGNIETRLRAKNAKSKKYDIAKFETQTEKINNPEKEYNIDTDFYDNNINYYNQLNNVLPEGKQKAISQKIPSIIKVPERTYEINKGKITSSRRNNKYKFEFKSEKTKELVQNKDISKFKHTPQGKGANKKINQEGITIETHYNNNYAIANKNMRLRGKDNVMQGGIDKKKENTYAKAEAELGIINKKTQDLVKLDEKGKPQKILLPHEESAINKATNKLKKNIKTTKEAQKFQKEPTISNWLSKKLNRKNKDKKFKGSKEKTYIEIDKGDNFETPNKGELINRKENELNSFNKKENILETTAKNKINPEFNKYSQKAWIKLKKDDPIKYLKYKQALNQNKKLEIEKNIVSELEKRARESKSGKNTMSNKDLDNFKKNLASEEKIENFQKDWENLNNETNNKKYTSKQRKIKTKEEKIQKEKDLISNKEKERLEEIKIINEREQAYQAGQAKYAKDKKSNKNPEIKLFKNNKEFIADKYYGKKYSELTEQQKINTDLYDASDKAYDKEELLFIKKPSQLPVNNNKNNISIPKEIQDIAKLSEDKLNSKQKVMIDNYIKNNYNHITSSLAKYLDKNMLPSSSDIAKLANKHNISEATLSKIIAIKIAYGNYKEIGEATQTNELIREQLKKIEQQNLQEKELQLEVKQLLQQEMKTEMLQKELQQQKNLQKQELLQTQLQEPVLPQNLRLKTPKIPHLNPIKKFEIIKFRVKDKDLKKKKKGKGIKKNSYFNKRINDPLYRLTGTYAYDPIEQKRVSNNMGSFYSGVDVRESLGYNKLKKKKNYNEEKKFLSQTDLIKLKNKKLTQNINNNQYVNPYKEKKYTNSNNSKQMQKIIQKRIFKKR